MRARVVAPSRHHLRIGYLRHELEARLPDRLHGETVHHVSADKDIRVSGLIRRPLGFSIEFIPPGRQRLELKSVGGHMNTCHVR